MNYMDEYLNNKINIYASIEHDYLEYRVYLGHEMIGKFNTLNEAWAFADVYIERLLRFRKTQESKEKVKRKMFLETKTVLSLNKTLLKEVKDNDTI